MHPCIAITGCVRPSIHLLVRVFGPSISWSVTRSFSLPIKGLSKCLQSFSFNLSFSICLSISLFTVFLSQFFPHYISFLIFPWQSFFHNLFFKIFLHNHSFTIFFSQSISHNLSFTIFIFNLFFSLSAKGQTHCCPLAGLFKMLLRMSLRGFVRPLVSPLVGLSLFFYSGNRKSNDGFIIHININK